MGSDSIDFMSSLECNGSTDFLSGESMGSDSIDFMPSLECNGSTDFLSNNRGQSNNS